MVRIHLPPAGSHLANLSIRRIEVQGRSPSDDMISWPVSARVGNVRNNDSSLIEPVATA
jgi:putative SOS response-associated peptidase YedK